MQPKANVGSVHRYTYKSQSKRAVALRPLSRVKVTISTYSADCASAAKPRGKKRAGGGGGGDTGAPPLVRHVLGSTITILTDDGNENIQKRSDRGADSRFRFCIPGIGLKQKASGCFC